LLAGGFAHRLGRMNSIVRSTLAEQAYETLQNRIVYGALPAGQRLLADELADSLAISQTPVKEALARLERDGLVEAATRRGSIVRRFGPEDIEEIYTARILIELNATETGMTSGAVTPEFVSTLREIYDEQMTYVEKQREEALVEAIRLDREFHEKIVGLGRNQLLAGWHRVVLRQTQTIRNYSLVHYDVGRTRREHSAIVEAFERGAAGDVLAALRAHLIASRDEFLSRPSEELPIRP
jgi:DNA-binding GntR family transcriptional regulator